MVNHARRAKLTVTANAGGFKKNPMQSQSQLLMVVLLATGCSKELGMICSQHQATLMMSTTSTTWKPNKTRNTSAELATFTSTLEKEKTKRVDQSHVVVDTTTAPKTVLTILTEKSIERTVKRLEAPELPLMEGLELP